MVSEDTNLPSDLPYQKSRAQRLKLVMTLGDRVKANRKDAAAISQLVAVLDNSICWLAGSALGLLGGTTVVHTLFAPLKQAEAPKARQEAISTLKRIVDNPTSPAGGEAVVGGIKNTFKDRKERGG